MKKLIIIAMIIFLTSCSLDSMVDGVEARVISYSQEVVVESVYNNYIAEVTSVLVWASLEVSEAQDLLSRNLIQADEYLELVEGIKSEKENRLLAVEDKYKRMSGIWSPANAIIEFVCSNPSSTNVKLVLHLRYYDGTTGISEVFPGPLLKGQTYSENISIRTSKYISDIVSVDILKN